MTTKPATVETRQHVPWPTNALQPTWCTRPLYNTKTRHNITEAQQASKPDGAVKPYLDTHWQGNVIQTQLEHYWPRSALPAWEAHLQFMSLREISYTGWIAPHKPEDWTAKQVPPSQEVFGAKPQDITILDTTKSCQLDTTISCQLDINLLHCLLTYFVCACVFKLEILFD